MSEWVKLAQLCPTLCNPVDYTVHGILQARILEWVTFPFSRGSSQPRDRTQVSLIAGGFFTSWVVRGTQEYWSGWPILSPSDFPYPGIEPGSPAWQADSNFIWKTSWSRRWGTSVPKNHHAWDRIQDSSTLKGEGVKSDISWFWSASWGDVLISSFLWSSTGGLVRVFPVS